MIRAASVARTQGTYGRAILATTALLLAGCDMVTMPSCGDEVVTKLVDELLREQSANALVPTAIMTETRTAPQMWGNPDYAQLKTQAQGDAQARKVVEAVDKQLAAVSLVLSGFRTDRVDDQVKKVWCAADYTASVQGKATASDSVSYTAQFTDAGDQVYVQLQE